MTATQAIVARLLADAGVVALVGDRIDPGRPSQSATWPVLTYRLISGTDSIAQDGGQGLRECRIEINAWAYTYLETEELAEAVNAALHGQTWRSSEIGYIAAFHAGERDLPEDPQLKGEKRIERRSVDYLVTFRAA